MIKNILYCHPQQSKAEIYIIHRLVPHIQRCGVLYTRDKIRLPYHTYAYAMDISKLERAILKKMRDFEVYGIGYCKAKDDWWVEYLNEQGFAIKRWKFQECLRHLEELSFIHRNTYTVPIEAGGGKKRTMITCWGTYRYGQWLTKERTYKGKHHKKPDTCLLAFMRFRNHIKELNGDQLNHPLILHGSTSINRNVPLVHEYCNYTYNTEEKDPYIEAKKTHQPKKVEDCFQTLFQPQSNLDIWLKKGDIHYPESILNPLLVDSNDRKKIIRTLCSRQKWLKNKEYQLLDMVTYIMEGKMRIPVRNPLRMAISLVLNPRKIKTKKEDKPIQYENYAELLPSLEFEFTSYQPPNLCKKKTSMAKSLAFEIKDKFNNILEEIGFEILEAGIRQIKYDELICYDSPYIFLHLITESWGKRGIREIYEYTKQRFGCKTGV